MIIKGEALPDKVLNHSLNGEYKHCNECHIEPDWLLIYEIKNDLLVLLLLRTGSHSEVF